MENLSRDSYVDRFCEFCCGLIQPWMLSAAKVIPLYCREVALNLMSNFFPTDNSACLEMSLQTQECIRTVFMLKCYCAKKCISGAPSYGCCLN